MYDILKCWFVFMFFRLRHIVKKLQKDDITKEDLIKNLEYTASVLETVYIDETRLVKIRKNIDTY